MSATTARHQPSSHVPTARDKRFQETDMAALRAIAQAAVEVELFTIPLYMASMYSIQGMHEITSQGSKAYQGRLWPGPATTANPSTPNEAAFNVVFSVFIQEMLHLQLAANMATAISAPHLSPIFTSSALQSPTHGWTCYGPTNTVIPHIVDLRDTTTYHDVIVNTGPLTPEQLRLFLAIEQPEDLARHDIKDPKKYFPTVPFDGWKQGDPLPMFGTIGWMYQCYLDYLHIKYDDQSTLWDAVFNPNGQQNDLFNTSGASGHPMREFMGFETTIALTYKDIAFGQMAHMMDAITDQGEGSVLVRPAALLRDVEPRYQPNLDALRSDYPDFSDTGVLEPSADAEARYPNDKKDHFQRFKDLFDSGLRDVVTWPEWHKTHGPWTADDLRTSNYVANPKVPSPEDVAAALNTLAADPATYYKLLSQASIGAIAGVTTVLDTFWNSALQSSSPVSFPFPAMSGSGDRMSICWAVFGEVPDLSLGLDPPVVGTLYHSCQALDYNPGQKSTNQCAPVTVFHACRGSNGCHAEGGCGFVQSTAGGGSCGSKLSTRTALETRTFGGCVGPASGPDYSAPGDNMCKTFGGCAVPISASQLFPKSGKMQLYGFKQEKGDWTSVPLKEPLLFNVGDNVHDVAWAAYKAVMQLDETTPPPKPTPLRLVFPPST